VDLVRAVRRAVKIFQDQASWQAMMLGAMAQDFSLHRSAKEYLAVFDRTIAARRAKKK
jgi:glycogen synthase